jgi:hypothetical protein
MIYFVEVYDVLGASILRIDGFRCLVILLNVFRRTDSDADF